MGQTEFNPANANEAFLRVIGCTPGVLGNTRKCGTALYLGRTSDARMLRRRITPSHHGVKG
jgi:hypothetical protein